MKFVTLSTKRTDERGKLEKPPRSALKPLSKASRGPHQARTYTELRQQIHDDLRIQHPEWIEPNGECPMCDAYEARLIEVLEHLTPGAAHESNTAHDPNFEHGLN